MDIKLQAGKICFGNKELENQLKGGRKKTEIDEQQRGNGQTGDVTTTTNKHVSGFRSMIHFVRIKKAE